MKKADRFKKVLEYFAEQQPFPETELKYKSSYELMVAVILSAQCSDKRVNMITPAFFDKFPDLQSLSVATQEEIFEMIKSCSYPNNKSKHLKGMAEMLIADFDGKVPQNIAELQKLPGIGRKSANVIASVIFKKPAMAVDTHVFRVSARIGLTSGAKTPLQAEKQLVKCIPEDQIHLAHHWLILHGRYVCTARSPKCSECGISEFCKYYGKKVNR